DGTSRRGEAGMTDLSAADSLRQLTQARAERAKVLAAGGGPGAAKRQHEKKRLTARERLELLFDPGSPRLEVGLWAGDGMYEERGGAPGAGVVTVIGTICGREHMVIANDATV